MRGTIKRRSIPVSGSIHWKPLRDPHYVLASLQPDQQYRQVFVDQPVLLRVLDAARSTRGRYAHGLLLGEQCECPSTGARYVTVSSLLEQREAAPNEAAAIAGIVELLHQRIARGLEVLGWYCCGGPDEPRLTPPHTAMHASAFREPWHVGLLVSGTASSGGFFLRDTRESRWFTAPFFEMTGPPRRGQRATPTCIAWESYMTTDAVVALPRPEPRVISARPAAPTPPEPIARSERHLPRVPTLAPSARTAGRYLSRAGAIVAAAGVRGSRTTIRRMRAIAVRCRTAVGLATRWLGSATARAARAIGRLAMAAARSVSEHASRGARIAGRSAAAGATRATTWGATAFVRREARPAPSAQAVPPAPLTPTAASTRPAESEPVPTFRDTTSTDTAGRYIEVARIEGFFIAGRFETEASGQRETLWVLNEPRAGLLLTVVAVGSQLREAMLHYNVGPDGAPWLDDIPPQHRDRETGTAYVTEPCIESLRARCRRLRSSGKIEREWKLSPKLQLITPAEREALARHRASHVTPVASNTTRVLNQRRIDALPASVRRQFGLDPVELAPIRAQSGNR